jgi:hypothetical protein
VGGRLESLFASLSAHYAHRSVLLNRMQSRLNLSLADSVAGITGPPVILRRTFSGAIPRNDRAGRVSVSGDWTALIASGEEASRLDQVIRRQLRQWNGQLELQWDTLAEWAPRLIYAAIAGFMAIGIFSGYRGLNSLHL